MDTREKIVVLSDAAERLRTGKWTVVPGLFDPLTATQAKRLHGLKEGGRKLAAFVEQGGETLLPAEARAALVAALRDVDLVCIAHGEWRKMIADSQRVRVVEDPDGEASRSAEFVKFVVERQGT
ncbi:MAG: hypothetical protein JO022_04135 [Acidobacteriaceae bacterium]|nr:hypothetical protein [Acidobacteriaceae bacterium]